MLYLKEYISHFLNDFLNENKFDDAIKLNPKLKDELEYFKNGHMNSGYIPWIIKMLNSNDSGYFSIRDGGRDNLDILEKNLIEFYNLSKKNQIPLNKKDINNVISVSELFDIVFDAKENISKTQFKKKVKSQAKKVYENEKYLIVEPNSKEAACYYGKDTKWCISAAQSANYFDDYVNRGYKFLFIIDKLAAENKVAIAYKKEDSSEEHEEESIQAFDSEDNKIRPGKLHFDEDITNFINSYLKTDIFHSFSPEEWIKKLPESLKEPGEFLTEANSNELLEALSYIAKHGIVYIPAFTGLAEYFINFILKRFDNSNFRGFQYKLYKIIRTEPNKANLNLDGNKILRLLRKVIIGKFSIQNGALVDPFIWAPSRVLLKIF